jgi:hypothetical protein
MARYESPAAQSARTEIETLKADKSFYKLLLEEKERGVSGPANQKWADLHRTGWPAPTAVASQDDVNAQLQSRAAEQMNGSIAALLKIANLSPAMQEEFRRQQPVAKWEQDFAREEIQRLKRDVAFVRRYLNGDREASTIFTRMHLLISMPTATTTTTYPVKA